MPKARRTVRDEFTSEDCGQNALQLTARGSALIAEILRLSEFIPPEFRHPDRFPDYKSIVSDFRYFNEQDNFEQVIQNSATLLQRDEEFRDTHMELLERFFKLFRGVHGYLVELNRFIEDIQEGLYISHSIESILAHPTGKQLLCEIYYLLGVMLLLLDTKIPGKTREFLIVSYVRYKGAGEQQTVEVARLFRSTGRTAEKMPNRYPEEYFSRCGGIDKRILGQLIGRIRSDDVYNMLLNYPDPEHRSTALATQGSVLFILLFFHSKLLDDRVIMREIVDKHFADNWIIAYYMGFTADIAHYWKPFAGATAAVQATIAKDNVLHTKRVLTECVHASNEHLLELLRDGVLTDQFILDGITSKLLPAMRVANVALRFFILHNHLLDPAPKPDAGLKADQLRRLCTSDDVLKLLLRLSQLEFILKDRFERLLHEKKRMWNEAKEQSVTKMNKLSQYFSGDHVLSDNVRMVQFEQWFADTAESIDGLSYNSSMGASQTIQKLMKAIDNIAEFHQVSSNLQVVQFLNETKQLLRQMIRVTNIEVKVSIMVSTIADLSYAWERFATERCFVAEIQDIIRRDPRLTIQMRSAFVKMASVIVVPCSRIYQAVANTPSLEDVVESVSNFYSSQLVTFVKEVLHVIPKTIFATLSEIANLVRELKECPNKINRKLMKEQSQLALRAKLAMLTSKVSQFACGILAMKSTLVGVIEVEPQQLLEEGIRAELRAQVSSFLQTLFEEKKGEKNKIVLSTSYYDQEMTKLAANLNGLKLSFEYVQDYIDVQGLRIWLEEFSRIVNFNVEMECNSYMHRKLYPWKSRYYAEGIPTQAYQQPVYPCSFLGRLMHAILSMARASLYLPALGSWYDIQTRGEIVGDRTFECISLSLGCQGLAALNRLMCFLAAKQTHEVITVLRKKVEANEGVFARWRNLLLPTSAAVENAKDAQGDQQTFHEMEECITKKICHLTIDALEQIGRLQLVRDSILTRLRADTKLNSGMLFSSLMNTNKGLIEDLEQHYTSPLEHPMPGSIIPEVAEFLEVSGVSSSHDKVYVTTRALPEIPFILAMLVTHNAARFVYDPEINTLKPKERNDRFAVDPVCFCHGVLTILRQFHSEQKKLFFNLLGRAIRGTFTLLTEAKDKARSILYDDLEAMVRLAETLADRGGLDISVLHDIIPSTLLCDPNVR